MKTYKIVRDWWYPFVVSVWENDPRYDGDHWRKGPYQTWWRRGVFFRKRTAQEFIEWLREREGGT
jgi:hypothetical protein